MLAGLVFEGQQKLAQNLDAVKGEFSGGVEEDLCREYIQCSL
jgi:hypothetical protein